MEVAIAPGGATGGHFRQGVRCALVREGALSHADADSALPAGQRVRRAERPDDVHIGRNSGPTPVVPHVDPAGAPLPDDAPDPGCGS